MIRKQINVPEDIHRSVSVIADQENKSESQVIREFIEDGIRKKRKQMTLGEALLGLANIGEKYRIDAPADLSDRIDDELYGDKT